MSRQFLRKPSVILLDHDGTLVDSEVVHFECWQRVLSSFQCELPHAMYGEQFVGLSEWNTADAIRAFFSLDLSVADLLAKKRSVVAEFQATRAFPVLPTVDACVKFWAAAGIRLAVVSGSNQATVKASVEACGWQHLMEGVYTGDQVAHNKPAPDVYQLALDALGVSAADALAVEDSFTGLTAARAAGLDCCVVANEWSGRQDFTSALKVFNTMQALADWLNLP